MISVGKWGRSTVKDPARSPPGSASRFRGSIGGVSVGYFLGTGGGAEGVQPLGRWPQSSPVSWQLMFLSSGIEV